MISADLTLAELSALRETARAELRREGCTFAACSSDRTLTSTARGVAPLLRLLDESVSLAGYGIADKVVGKSAAFLYVLLDARCLHAEIISTPALALLRRYGIDTDYTTEVPMIRNRTNDGYCPMEQAVLALEDPSEALQKLRETLAVLRSGN